MNVEHKLPFDVPTAFMVNPLLLWQTLRGRVHSCEIPIKIRGESVGTQKFFKYGIYCSVIDETAPLSRYG